MVCPMCSMEHDEFGFEAQILDLPRYLAVAKPCLNCGAGAREQAAQPRRPTPVVDVTAQGRRRNARRLLYAAARESAALPA